MKVEEVLEHLNWLRGSGYLEDYATYAGLFDMVSKLRNGK